MTRDTGICLDKGALQHNLQQIRTYAPHKQIIAMVKANAYGCGIENVVPVIADDTDAFGVACLGEAMAIHRLGIHRECIIFGGVFSAEELRIASVNNMQIVVHAPWQLNVLLETRLAQPISVWIKFDSGMHRLGFQPEQVAAVYQQLQSCAWVNPRLGLMSHFSCADTPDHPMNHQQLTCFKQVQALMHSDCKFSMANSAAIMTNRESHGDFVRPGIMLYGVSPFEHQTAKQLNLRPVMQFRARILDIHDYSSHQSVGYGATWQTQRASRIAVVTAGYGDGYPRHIKEETTVYVAGQYAPIVGRISMDLMTIDITDCPHAAVGDVVELWGEKVPVEYVAAQAGTIAYELLCRYKARPSS